MRERSKVWMSIAPADSPKRVILEGSPPNEVIYLRTQAIAVN